MPPPPRARGDGTGSCGLNQNGMGFEGGNIAPDRAPDIIDHDQCAREVEQAPHGSDKIANRFALYVLKEE